jgi:hypothetical protein
MAEANKYAAGEWKRAHAPQGLLPWLERYHSVMRRESAVFSVSRAARQTTK